jgi:hypothetical protein
MLGVCLPDSLEDAFEGAGVQQMRWRCVWMK